MTLTKTARQIGLLGLVVSASNVFAYADSIVSWDNQASTNSIPVSALVSATSGFGGTAGTEIRVINTVINNSVDNNSDPISGAPIRMTFDFRSTDADIGSNNNIV
jgi:hypothetical protein